MSMNPRLLRPKATRFNPKSIASLGLWIDFADTSTVTLDENNKISAVLDKSGNGFSGTQTTSGDRLGVSTLNGLQCADNGTAANSLSVSYNPNAITTNLRHTFIVARWDAGGSTFPTISVPLSAHSFLSLGDTGVGAVLVGNNGTSRWNPSGPTVMVGTGRRWRTNGGIVYTDSTNFTALEAFAFFGSTFLFAGDAQETVTINGWRIGNDRLNVGRGWRGRICEVVSYTASLSLSQQNAVESYLARKWGVTLA